MDLCSPDALVKTIIEFRNSNDMGFMFYAENLKNILNKRNTMFTKLTQKLESFIKLGIPGYDCVVYHKGKCVYRHQNGYSDRENKVVMNGNELYNIYSCSKVITCTAALMLYEMGKYKLEDKLSDYMPEFETMYIKTDVGIKKAENSITIKDLFCMTAGFSY